MTLFDYAERYPATPGYKDRDTSKKAAQSIDSATLRRSCLLALKSIGPATADEIAAHLELSVLSVRPRFTELLRLDQIEDTGTRRANDSGRSAKVWRTK